MADRPGDGIEFVGCDLTYHTDSPAFAKDPTTTESHTHRPVTINGKRMLVIDMHAHSQVSDVWPLVEGRPELEGQNFFAQGPLKRVEDLSTRLTDMDRMGIDMEVQASRSNNIFIGPNGSWLPRSSVYRTRS